MHILDEVTTVQYISPLERLMWAIPIQRLYNVDIAVGVGFGCDSVWFAVPYILDLVASKNSVPYEHSGTNRKMGVLRLLVYLNLTSECFFFRSLSGCVKCQS